MKDLCGDYRDERQQGAGRWAALSGAIRFWIDDRSTPENQSEPGRGQAATPVVPRVAEQQSH